MSIFDRYKEYRISYDNPLPGMVPPYVIERREGFGWRHVTRINDPAQFEAVAETDASQQSFKSRTHRVFVARTELCQPTSPSR